MNRRHPPSNNSGIEISFEMFPPKADGPAERLMRTVTRLATLNPDFFTLTYGAGGSSKLRSLRTIAQMCASVDEPVAAHLTCVGASRAELRETVREFLDRGVSRFVALRGDPPTGVGTRYEPHPDGYADTAELVADLRTLGATDVSVSAYPERHPDSPDWDHEIAVLKRKADAGADRAVTQFFFDNDDFERFRDRVEAAGITIPVVPGILPIHNIRKVRQFAAKCGASVPNELLRKFADIEPDTDVHKSTAIRFAKEQIGDLLNRDVRHFHIYTMNEADLTEAVCLAALPRRSEDKSAA